MSLSPHRWILCASLLASSALVSCSIRLPVSPLPETPAQPLQATQKLPQADANPRVPVSQPIRDPDLLVWLTADDYHTGMVFPFDWLVESGFIPPANFGSPRYVALSWGNRDAYSEHGIDSKWKLIQVLLTPTPAVMELIPANWNVAEVCPHQRIWRKLVSRDRGQALAHFLNQCSVTNPDGLPRVVRPSSWGNGVQLESRYSYFIPRVCNVWTVQTIEALGGTINPWFALTANGLIRAAEKPPNCFEQIWHGSPAHD